MTAICVIGTELSPGTPLSLRRRPAEKHDAWLIAVGTYGESPLCGAVLGSTPRKLLHWSSRPVLCVPPAAHEDD